MSVILLPSRWQQQPQYPVEADRGHQLLKGCLDFNLFLPTGFVSILDDGWSTVTGVQPTAYVTPGGVGRLYDSTSAAQMEELPVNFTAASMATNGAYTLFVRGGFPYSGGKYASAGTNYGNERAFYGLRYNNTGAGAAIGQKDGANVHIAQSLIANRLIDLGSPARLALFDAFAWFNPTNSLLEGQLNDNAVVQTAAGTATLMSTAPVDPAIRCGYNGSTSSPGSKIAIVGGVWLRMLQEGERQALRENPWQVMRRNPRRVYFDVGAGGGAAALDGAAAGTVTASGTLTTQIPISGAAAVVATASGALSTSIPLSGQAASISVAGGVLTTQISLSGAALAQATATGALSGGAAQLTGAASAQATAGASLTTQISLSGAALAEALAQASLTAGSGLTGAATAQAGASGSLLTAIPLSGAAQAYSTAAGGLSTIIPLAGAAASVSSASGNLTLEVTLTGAALALALAGGDLTTVIRLDGAALAQAAASGSLGTALGIPATLPHLIEAVSATWEIEAHYGSWEIAA